MWPASGPTHGCWWPKESESGSNGSARRGFCETETAACCRATPIIRVEYSAAPPMALIVQKYGGTSVGSVERIKNVALRIAKWSRAGHRLVVVPSAMSGETNRLIALAK